MALEPVPSVTGLAVFIPGADIDTDRIIPARFMKCVTFDGLGEFAFYDVRFDEHGVKTKHPLNDPRFSKASILVAGVNFGCGSSREHAPQSLRTYGFNGVIAESFAEIFYGNSTTLAMPCVMASPEDTVRQSITFRYNSVKSKVALMEARLKDVNNLVKVKNPSLLL